MSSSISELKLTQAQSMVTRKRLLRKTIPCYEPGASTKAAINCP